MSSRQNSPRRIRLVSRAFSLIEVTLALGIVSFAMMGILGMVPVGLQTFRKAINLTVESSIVQNVSGEILRTDYANLSATNLYFDEQGTLLAGGGNDPSRIYTVQVASPQSLDATSLVASGAASTVVIRINNRAQPAVTNSYSLVVPKSN